MEPLQEPFITFFQLFPSAPAPRRADPSLLGSIPLRAHRYCEPFTTGCGFGWYGFPPTDFALLWDGTNVFWKPADQTWWVGPAVTPIRLCKTDQPILFRTRRPLFQIQPVLKHAYADTTLDSALVVDDLATLRPDQWQAFEDAIMLRNAPGARSGTYKLERRRRAGIRHQADKAKEI